MPNTLSLSLTDELRSFIDANSGDGTLFATPDEFVRDVIRQRKHQVEAAEAREAILEGYQDVVDGRVTEYKGDLIGVGLPTPPSQRRPAVARLPVEHSA